VKTVVTGGAGFVGSHLVERLLAAGHHVTAIDDLSSGMWDNLAGVRGHPQLSCVEHDVRTPFRAPCDRIYHLASPASPRDYQADPVRTTLVGVLGTLHALELAEQNGARLLLASTSEVYGDPLVHPQVESDRGHVDPVGARACYAEGKRCAETLCGDFARSGRAEVRIARIFNTYGPRMGLDDGRLVVTFVRQALTGEPLTVHGDGSQTRSLCAVDDLVAGLLALMEHPVWTGPVNLGNEDERSVLDVARAVLEIVPGGVITHAALPDGDPVRRRPDLTRARELLGYAPRVTLEDGLRGVVDDVRRRIHHNASQTTGDADGAVPQTKRGASAATQSSSTSPSQLLSSWSVQNSSS
jgi:UDP-glucuronate decarboxylase